MMKKILKEAYIAPIALSLFLVPIFWNGLSVHSFIQGKELIFKTIMLCTGIGFAWIFAKRGELKFKQLSSSVLFLFLLVQVCVLTITNLFSENPTVAFYGTYSRGFGMMMELFIFSFVLYCALALSEASIRKLLKIAFVGGLIVSIYGLMQKIGIDPFFSNYDTNIFVGRIFSFLGNPSYLGQYMVLQAIIGGYLGITEQNGRSKKLLFLGTAIVFAALLFSGTRTAILGLVGATILLSIKYAGGILVLIKKNYRKVFLAILAFLMIVMILPKDRFSLSDVSTRSLNSRIEIWKGTAGLIKERPFSGYGNETFYIYFPEIITKKFLTLEENLNISADRVHNETLEVFFSNGIFALIIYLLIIAFILRLFFKSKNETESILSLLILTNMVQNQFGFSDITIRLLIAFCLGAIIAIHTKNEVSIKLGKYKKKIYGLAIFGIFIIVGFVTIIKPFMSQLAYAKSKENYKIDYSIAVNKHKEALYYTPYYSELWYELMFIDASSMERALHYLGQIEGNSGNVLAWKGNFYSKTDPAKASEFYTMALEKNSYHPNWIRAFADMLYEKGDYENAIYLYGKYLEAIPDFWKWKDELEKRTDRERRSYETFLKHTPYFWGIIEKIERIILILEEKDTSS